LLAAFSRDVPENSVYHPAASMLLMAFQTKLPADRELEKMDMQLQLNPSIGKGCDTFYNFLV